MILLDYAFCRLLRLASALHMTDPPTAATALMSLLMLAVSMPLTEIAKPRWVTSDGAPFAWGVAAVTAYFVLGTIYSPTRRSRAILDTQALSGWKRLACQVFFVCWVISALATPVYWIAWRVSRG
jgi:hypothetical protein